MQIYVFGLHLPKLPLYLFLGKKNWGIEKTASSLVCHTDFSILCFFAIFVYRKRKKENIYVSLFWNPVPRLFLLPRLFIPSLFFRGPWKPCCRCVEAITWKRAGLVLLDGDAASYVRNLDDKYSRRLRAEDYHYCFSARPFSILLCFHFLSSLCCQLKKNPTKENVQPNLEFLFESNVTKVAATQTWDASKQKWQAFTP